MVFMSVYDGSFLFTVANQKNIHPFIAFTYLFAFIDGQVHMRQVGIGTLINNFSRSVAGAGEI